MSHRRGRAKAATGGAGPDVRQRRTRSARRGAKPGTMPDEPERAVDRMLGAINKASPRRLARQMGTGVIVFIRSDGSKATGLVSAQWPKEDWTAIKAAAQAGGFALGEDNWGQKALVFTQ